MNPFENESFTRASERQGKKKVKKRAFKGAALTFAKRKKATKE